MSQKITLSNADKKHLPKIKSLLLQGKSQVEISVALGLRRETVNRKIRRWMQTEDFEQWLKEVWLDLYREVRHDNPVEAFRQISKILGRVLEKKPSLAEQIREIEIRWEDDESEINDKVQASSRAKTVSP